MPILSLDYFKVALSQDELNWYNVVEWQRWGWGYVNEENSTIILHKEDVIISTYFAKCEYKIVYKIVKH
ncbi:MAG: hypothetical protein U9O20_00175 [Patescibacteria group bacterium]|nr:hypothetical protein [Patescibacteria group bacterium]